MNSTWAYCGQTGSNGIFIIKFRAFLWAIFLPTEKSYRFHLDTTFWLLLNTDKIRFQSSVQSDSREDIPKVKWYKISSEPLQYHCLVRGFINVFSSTSHAVKYLADQNFVFVHSYIRLRPPHKLHLTILVSFIKSGFHSLFTLLFDQFFPPLSSLPFPFTQQISATLSTSLHSRFLDIFLFIF